MSIIHDIQNAVTANGMREWTDERVRQAMREYAKAVADDALKRAAENAKIMVSNGETHLDVKSYTLCDGIIFSPDYNRILSTPINNDL